MALCETQEKLNIFKCIICEYSTERKSHWNRHLKTKKHNKYRDYTNTKKKTKEDNNDNTYTDNQCKSVNKPKCNYIYNCKCGKIYKYLSGLSRHKSICKDGVETSIEKYGLKYYNEQDGYTPSNSVTNDNNDKNKNDNQNNNENRVQNIKSNTTNRLLKEQNEFLQNQLIEMKDIFYKLLDNNKELHETTIMMAKEPRTVNNNQFNIMNYLNTECKDAINLTEFIDQINYTFKDLIQITDEGWVENVKNTFVKKLKDMEQSKRPIHCSDKKRKTFYVKDNNVWEKDMVKERITQSLNQFHTKQSKVYIKWKDMNKEKVIRSNDLHDKSMYMNIELCKLSCENGEKLKNKIFNSMTELTFR